MYTAAFLEDIKRLYIGDKMTDDEKAIDLAKANVYQRILWVSRKVPYIQKDTKVEGAGGYNAVSHDAVLAKVGPLMNQMELCTTISEVGHEIRNTPSGKMMLYCATFTCNIFVASEPGLICTMIVPGHGADSLDKAPNKAMTYAFKNFLLKTFRIETGINEESQFSGPVDKDAQEAELEELAETIEKMTDIDAIRNLFKAHRANMTATRRGHLQQMCAARVKELETEEKTCRDPT